LLAFLRQKIPLECIRQVQRATSGVAAEHKQNAREVAITTNLVEDTNKSESQPSKRMKIIDSSHEDIFESMEAGRTYKQLVLDVMSKLKAIVQEVHHKTNVVHMDIRPDNVVVFPTADGEGIERVMIIDWGSVERVGAMLNGFVGVPAYVSDDLHVTGSSFPPGQALKMYAATMMQIPIIQRKFDWDSLKHTHTVLLHGGSAFVPPWNHRQTDDMLSLRKEWYKTHKAMAPHCPCLLSCP
jgi:serine/threonine protein kinase